MKSRRRCAPPRNADPLTEPTDHGVELSETIRRVVEKFSAADAEQAGPLFWPRLSADDASGEWGPLYDWVEALRMRYPNGVRLPDCWYRHSDIVEALSALRDFERAAFSAKAPATSAVEWQRAFRDIEQRLDTWTRRLSCSVPGRGHPAPARTVRRPEGWDEFVREETATRQRSTGPRIADQSS